MVPTPAESTGEASGGKQDTSPCHGERAKQLLMRVEAHLCEACFRAPAPLLSPRDRPPRVELMRDRLGSVGTETSIGEKTPCDPRAASA